MGNGLTLMDLLVYVESPDIFTLRTVVAGGRRFLRGS
jgi:hypothetical protein